MASNLEAMASTLVAMHSNLEAMAMASPNSDGFKPRGGPSSVQLGELVDWCAATWAVHPKGFSPICLIRIDSGPVPES